MNLFNKTFKISFGVFVATEFLSIIAYFGPQAQSRLFFFFLILFLFLIASLIKLEYGLYILLAELFIGGKGYLFSLQIFNASVSIRIAFFIALFVIWLVKTLSAKLKTKSFFNSNASLLATSYLALLIIIACGIINGFLNNSPTNVFFDANAWLFFLALPIFIDIIKSKKQADNIIQILLAATTWIGLKTITLLYLFSHDIVQIGEPFYKWIRDTGVGEITYIEGSLFRIFFQSHLYSLIAYFLVLIFIITKKARFDLSDNLRKQYFYLGGILYLTSLTVLISQSRSLWAGWIAGLLILAAVLIYKLKANWYRIGMLIMLLIFIFYSQTFAINIITENYADKLIAKRFNKEAASSSRINQLWPLANAISKNLIFGTGFGAELTYKSSDPRNLQAQPDGMYTTYAFEWGYFDIWLKLGLAGLIIYLFFISKIFYLGLKNFNYLSFGFLTGLLALCVVNIFSPYLNHPLGISYLLLATAIIKLKELQA